MGSVGRVEVPQVVAPGERVEIVAVVRNDAPTVQRVVGVLTGPVAAWADTSEQSVGLFSGTEGVLTFGLTVPTEVDWSGDVDFAFTARSEVRSESVELSFKLEGRPVVAVLLRPVTARRLRGSKHRVIVTNTGNVTAHVDLTADDHDDLLDMRVTPDRLELAPSTEADATLRTRALSYPRKGEIDRLPFSITAAWEGGKARLDGALQQRRHRVPAWCKLAALLAIFGVVGTLAVAASQTAIPLLGVALEDGPPKVEPRPTNRDGPRETKTRRGPAGTAPTSKQPPQPPVGASNSASDSTPSQVVVGAPVAPGGDSVGVGPGSIPGRGSSPGGGGAPGMGGSAGGGSTPGGVGPPGGGGSTGGGGTAPGTGGLAGPSQGPSTGGAAGSPSSLVTPTALMVVLDLSSSMTETDADGRLKLDGAKAAVNRFLQDVPPTTLVGLWTYPAAVSCSAGTLRIPITPVNTASMTATVRAMQASGNTPTADALRSAAGALPSTGPRSIVLISDGESNCDKPPCAVAQELAQNGIDLSINTIGFRISDAGRTELNCIANAARGRYKDVQNAADLAGELRLQSRTTLEMTVSSPAIVSAATATEPGGGVEIVATVRNTGPLLARDVEAFLRYSADRSPGTAIPRRRLGNLEPGESRTATWTFRPLKEFRNVRVGFEVSASAENSDTLLRQGSVNVTGSLDSGDGGPLFADRPVVAILGDSYSAGEGTFAYLPGTDSATNTCHRSAGTYGAGDVFKERFVFACSGAVASDVHNPHSVLRDPSNPSKALPSQVDQLASLEQPPDLALVTLGGNDARFRGMILACILPGECVESQGAALGGALQGLPDSLADAYRAIDGTLNSQRARLRRGRIAPIVVLAYPQLFPDRPLVRSDCSKVLSRTEIAFANDVSRRLNQVIAATVERLRSTGMPIWFASDTAKAMLPDHTMCDKVPWVNYVDLGDAALHGNDSISRFFDWLYGFPSLDDPSGRRISAAFHPNVAGYQAMTAALIRWSASAAGIEAAAGLGDLDRPPAKTSALGEPARTLTIRDGASVGALERGATYNVVASGFSPHAVTDVILRSGARVLARGRADDRGQVRTRIVVPLGAELGEHRLSVAAVNPAAPSVHARARIGEIKPRWQWPLLGSGSALAALGVLLTATGRSRLGRARRVGRPIRHSARRHEPTAPET